MVQLETKEQALDYVSRGWPILPLRPRDKEPHYDCLKAVYGTKEWAHLRSGTNADEVKRWFDFDENANIGLLAAKGLIIADVDYPSRVDGGGFPVTPMVQTSRGYHVFLDGRGLEIQRSKFDWGELISKTYVCAPPSLHESGCRYSWYPFLSHADVHIAKPPDWLLEKIAGIPPTSPPQEQTAARNNIISCCSVELQRGTYQDLAQDFDIARTILSRCGVEVKGLGKAFKCILPGHSEKHASAALWKPEGGYIGYHDFHFRDEAAWFTLADVWAAHETGEVRKLGKGEGVVWWLRCLHEIGAIGIPEVAHYELPGDARESVCKLYDGFVYLLRLRTVYDKTQRQAAPFSWRFAMSWCGIGSMHTIQRGMLWLLKRGYLVKVGETTGRKISLFALGKPREKTGEDICTKIGRKR